MSNPLLQFDGLPRFDEILPEHITPAIDQLLKNCRKVVQELQTDKSLPTWDNFIEPLDDCTEQLGRAWSIVGHLSSVVDSPDLRAAYNENLPKLTEFWTSLSQNLVLFEKYRAMKNSDWYDQLSSVRKRVIDNTLRDFKLGGAELDDQSKVKFAAIEEKLAALCTKFSENVLDAMNHFSLLVTDETQLEGLPEDNVLAAQALAKASGEQGYRFTLHFPSLYPVMQYAENRQLREKMYRANATRASELGEDLQWDNTDIIRQLLTLRKQQAQLLGYQTYAEVSLVPKMASSAEQVITFLEDLAHRARPSAEKDLQQLQNFASQELGIDHLQAWDMAYASEKLRQKQYSFSQQQVKQYFPEPVVLKGLFSLVEKLYSIQISEDKTSVWHKDVKFFRIEKNGELVGQFYMDLYARTGKRGGAWMDDARGRRLTKKGLQTPVAYLTCNFSEPVEKNGTKQVALFTHDEVMTLFHEFGHGMHHLLTRINEAGVSGISGVEWDAVELPSQFMENFCWEWSVLENMTSHVQTGEPLPKMLFDKMLSAKNFQSGMQMLRQIEFSLVDMHLHYDYDPSGEKTPQQVLDDIRRQYAVVIAPEFNRFLNAFSHIFAGGYAAGYYSYKWAEVLSADIYSAFEQYRDTGHDLVSTQMGEKFLKEVLSVGGSRPALESFVAFRGREPSIDALLRHNGLAS